MCQKKKRALSRTSEEEEEKLLQFAVFHLINFCLSCAFLLPGDGDTTEQNEPLLSSLDESSTVSLNPDKTINNPSVVNIVNETDGSNLPLLNHYEV